MSGPVKVAFVSGSDELAPKFVQKMRDLYPEAELYVVSEFPPGQGRWIPYHVRRGFRENYALCRAALKGKPIRLAGVILQPRVPYRRMRLIPLLMAPLRFIAYNENLDHFMLRPWCAGAIFRHFLWRIKNLLRWQLQSGGGVYTFVWRLFHPRTLERPILHLAARSAGWIAALGKRLLPAAADPARVRPLSSGLSVVIPSRNGRDLLERLLAGLSRELEGISSEVIVVDNGSDDGTAEFLRQRHPAIRLVLSESPLSFAEAVNRGIRLAGFDRVCLLNNDMILENGFFPPLLAAFEGIPDLFCATAQILFPEGRRREETGKAVMAAKVEPADFPVRCDVPLEGEDLSYVLYGSGGCSLYATEKLLRLGGLGELYQPAYVEDLDLGYRAWLRGWATVFVSGAQVLHEHRATTSRYYSREELDCVLEVNYLRFLARAVADPAVFRTLWRAAMRRLNLLASAEGGHRPAMAALRQAWRVPSWVEAPPPEAMPELPILALGSGDVTVFPGKRPMGRPRVLIASPYLPFPLSHGGAVRMFNLMRRAAADFDQVLVCFAEEPATPPGELLDLCCEIVLVRRSGSHLRGSSRRPDVVEEFDVPAFHAALRETIRKWQPGVAQLEFTQLAQYAADCAPAKTILVEHDITFDLYGQLLARDEDWELRRQWKRWLRFETAAWRGVDCVVTMSEKDRRTVRGARAECLPNGVDLDRFRPGTTAPDPARLLFIGSFAHLPNILAVEFFVREVWPALGGRSPVLHIIAGSRHRYYLDLYRDKVSLDLDQPGLEVEDFVADVRPAYERATVVVAPLLASAGTNIKIMEAMAMGKAIVSTPSGINGLDLEDGRDLVVARTATEMAAAIAHLLEDPGRRRIIEGDARQTVERRYGWGSIARRQRQLYNSLHGGG